jgi:serine phosphatase RsbU (regulator of sigma subunit)
MNNRHKKRANEQLQISNTEIMHQKDELQEKGAIIEIAYNDIKSSINYAKRIQEAILPIKDEIKRSFPESFVLFKPRDVVSGDFYWFANHSERNIIACVDCTGHGVPGAFMSMIGNTLLNEIVNEKGITKPSEILDLLHIRVRQSLKQNMENTETRDGMDIAICSVDTKNNILYYAGANRPIYIVRENKLDEIKPNKMSIGGDQMEEDRSFTNHEIDIKKSDTVYLSTDGYADQFGGERGKKFMVKRFQEELLEIQNLKMEQQGEFLKTTIENWQGDLEQVDDILVIGIKI